MDFRILIYNDSSHLFMIMMLFIVMISTVIMMYTELRSTRCVAQS